MYKMEITILKQKLRIEVIIACMILGYLLGGYLLCSCSKVSVKEGMQLLKGSAIDWKMGKGVPGSWENKQDVINPNMYQMLEGNSAENPYDMVEAGNLDILMNNKFDGKCCTSSSYSNSLGCACETTEQAKYLNQRGGNRTFSSEY